MRDCHILISLFQQYIMSDHSSISVIHSTALLWRYSVDSISSICLTPLPTVADVLWVCQVISSQPDNMAYGVSFLFFWMKLTHRCSRTCWRMQQVSQGCCSCHSFFHQVETSSFVRQDAGWCVVRFPVFAFLERLGISMWLCVCACFTWYHPYFLMFPFFRLG